MGDLQAAIHFQIADAAGRDGNASNVITYITRPMWLAWLHEIGFDPDRKDMQALIQYKTKYMYGSETRIVESDAYWSVSTARK